MKDVIIEEKSDFFLIIIESVNLMRFKCFFSPPALFSWMETNDRGKKMMTMEITFSSQAPFNTTWNSITQILILIIVSTLWHFHVHDDNSS